MHANSYVRLQYSYICTLCTTVQLDLHTHVHAHTHKTHAQAYACACTFNTYKTSKSGVCTHCCVQFWHAHTGQ